jgi:hypothetical protein
MLLDDTITKEAYDENIIILQIKPIRVKMKRNS